VDDSQKKLTPAGFSGESHIAGSGPFHNRLPLWHSHSPLRKELVARRFDTADQVALWVKKVAQRHKRSLRMQPIH